MQVKRYKNNNFSLMNLSESDIQTIKESLAVETGQGSKRAARLFTQIFLTPTNQTDFSGGRLNPVNI